MKKFIYNGLAINVKEVSNGFYVTATHCGVKLGQHTANATAWIDGGFCYNLMMLNYNFPQK